MAGYNQNTLDVGPQGLRGISSGNLINGVGDFGRSQHFNRDDNSFWFNSNSHNLTVRRCYQPDASVNVTGGPGGKHEAEFGVQTAFARQRNAISQTGGTMARTTSPATASATRTATAVSSTAVLCDPTPGQPGALKAARTREWLLPAHAEPSYALHNTGIAVRGCTSRTATNRASGSRSCPASAGTSAPCARTTAPSPRPPAASVLVCPVIADITNDSRRSRRSPTAATGSRRSRAISSIRQPSLRASGGATPSASLPSSSRRRRRGRLAAQLRRTRHRHQILLSSVELTRTSSRTDYLPPAQCRYETRSERDHGPDRHPHHRVGERRPDASTVSFNPQSTARYSASRTRSAPSRCGEATLSRAGRRGAGQARTTRSTAALRAVHNSYRSGIDAPPAEDDDDLLGPRLHARRHPQLALGRRGLRPTAPQETSYAHQAPAGQARITTPARAAAPARYVQRHPLVGGVPHARHLR